MCTNPRINTPDSIFSQMFSVKNILLSRGFEIIEQCNINKLLIHEKNFKAEIWLLIYEIFLDGKFRTELKNHLYNKEKITSGKVKNLVNHPKFIPKYQNFNFTLEWFVGELMVNKFAAFSHSFGVSVKHIERNTKNTNSGDFDSLVVLRDTNLAYFETKAGAFDGEGINKCYERMLALNCNYSILFCINKIDDKKLVWESKRVVIPNIKLHKLNKISIKGLEDDLIYSIKNCYIMDVSGNIENKIRTAIRINNAKINHSINAFGMAPDAYKNLGYNCDELDRTSYV
jgi:hypothetical protein